jgi:hypothetical protein
MSEFRKYQGNRNLFHKELSRMSRRTLLVVISAAAMLSLYSLAVTSPANAAPSPWWQVLTGSRPTNLWEADDSVQEVKTEIGDFFGIPGMAVGIEVQGELVGCFGNGLVGEFICPGEIGFPATETAAQLEALLEGVLGTTAVEVSGGPTGGEPFIITVPHLGQPPLTFLPAPGVGSASAEMLSKGGSGRLVLTITNLGNAPVDATGTPVKITDELPEGVVPGTIEAFVGAAGSTSDIECGVEGGTKVSCLFDGALPPYEAIEVEIDASLDASLTGEPPVAGAPGKVKVSGGNALPAAVSQPIKVSPDKTPFGIEHFSMQPEREGGQPTTQAGSHPYQLSTTIQFNSGPVKLAATRQKNTVEQPAQPRNLRFTLPAGMAGNVTKVPTCELPDFYGLFLINTCPDDSAIGVATVTAIETKTVGFLRFAVPVFNLTPAPGEPARFGFTAAGAPILIDTKVDPDNKYRLAASVSNTSQAVQVLSSTVVIWGTPGDSSHDDSRGWNCAYKLESLGPCERPAGLGDPGFLWEPASCGAGRVFSAEIEPWNVPLGSAVSIASSVSPAPSGCNQVPFNPSVGVALTSNQANGASGLDFQLDMPNDGLTDKNAVVEGQAKKIEATLPEGITVNPSQAAGIAACSPAQYAQETASSLPGQGCPEASKVGIVDVSTPLLDEKAKGAVYIAEPYDNPFDSLVALYIVAKIPERGVLVKQAGKVELDPKTGQIVTTFDDLPQLPFDSLKLHLFEGNRAPLVMPPKCGTYEIVTRFTPWHASDPDNPLPGEIVTRTSSFAVDQGPNGTPCPSGNPPFDPDFVAGTANNAAGSYSPFSIRLTREDDEQEFSRFSVKLPKGVLGILAGVPFCSEAAIAAAEARTGPHGGQEELDNPSCPSASRIGSTLAGAGVGPELSYAPGKIYLAGPYKGAKLSIVVISTVKVGPFDLGNVVVRQALRLNPDTAEVVSDGASADPLPHILQGVVVHLRDIQASLDRPNFMFNPTSCERMDASATVLSGDGQAAKVSSPFQAADCASLGFKPKLSIQLLGGTKRTANPRLKAVLTARKGDANLARVQVALPRSEFLEQSHIRTVCTRVQFNAGGGNGEQCPKGSIYGKMKVVSPVLDEVAQGPVFMRSSDNELPDLVAALHAPRADVNLVGRIDSLNGGIRTTFDATPDVPFTKAVLEMQGGKKGLIVNSVDICKAKHRATAKFKGQNGRLQEFNPVVKARCGGKKGKSGKRK